MSATELLSQIESLPETERRWLVRKILHMAKAGGQAMDETEWSNFSGSQLLAVYAPDDSVYDQD